MMRCPANPFCLCHVKGCAENGCAAQRNYDPTYRADAVVAPKPVQITRDMPGLAECRTCRHFEPNSATSVNGECRIARPVAREDLNGSALWPSVLGTDRCGEHARRLVPVEG